METLDLLRANLKRLAFLSCFVIVQLLLPVWAPEAIADNAGGAGFIYNSGNGSVSLRIKNRSDSALLTTVDITLPAGTSFLGTPSGGGSCSTSSAQTASCIYNPGKAPGEQAFVLINTNGSKPDSVSVTLNFDSGGSVAVNAVECGSITISPETLPNGTGNSPYSQQFSGLGGTGPYTFSIQGILPSDLTVSSSGLLSGTPGTQGDFSFTISGSDANACIGSVSYSLTIEPESTSSTADLEVKFVSFGYFFRHAEKEGTDNFLFGIGKATHLLVVDVPAPDSAGFKLSSNGWHAGAHTVIGVDIYNNGAATATYTAALEASAPLSEGPTYKGYLSDTNGIGAVIGDEANLLEFPPSQIVAGQHHLLLFSAVLPQASSVTFTATIPSYSPSDPNLVNNTLAGEFTLIQPPANEKVSWKESGNGGIISGTTTSAVAAQSVRLASSLFEEDDLPIEVAVLRIRGEKCAWLTGASGSLQKKASVTNCFSPIFKKVKGTDKWRYSLRRSPGKGTYYALIRFDNGDDSLREFSSDLDSLMKFKIP